MIRLHLEESLYLVALVRDEAVDPSLRGGVEACLGIVQVPNVERDANRCNGARATRRRCSKRGSDQTLERKHIVNARLNVRGETEQKREGSTCAPRVHHGRKQFPLTLDCLSHFEP